MDTISTIMILLLINKILYALLLASLCLLFICTMMLFPSFILYLANRWEDIYIKWMRFIL